MIIAILVLSIINAVYPFFIVSPSPITVIKESQLTFNIPSIIIIVLTIIILANNC